MFQLIIIVLAVVITIAIAIATIYFGGSSFVSSGEKALFTRYMQHGVQIQAALQLTQITVGTLPTGTSDQQLQALITNNTLQSIPNDGWIIQNEVIYKSLDDSAQCMRLNKFQKLDVSDTSLHDSTNHTVADYNGCPPCGEAAFNGYPACFWPSPLDPSVVQQ